MVYFNKGRIYFGAVSFPMLEDVYLDTTLGTKEGDYSLSFITKNEQCVFDLFERAEEHGAYYELLEITKEMEGREKPKRADINGISGYSVKCESGKYIIFQLALEIKEDRLFILSLEAKSEIGFEELLNLPQFKSVIEGFELI